MKQKTEKKATVLIIDDSVELLEVFKIVFEKQGYEIIAKTSTKDIFNFLAHHEIDILLLDVVLKDANGRTLCRELKQDPVTSYFPVVLMSASPENLTELNECGADGFIEKPFDISYIVDKINSLLYQSHEVHRERYVA